MTTAKSTVAALNLKVGEAVVYPGRGVGQVTAIEEQEVAGFKLEMYVISFDKEKATIRIPVGKAAAQRVRRVSDQKTVNSALDVMSGRARKSKMMWSRRAQELEAKVNSGDLTQMAEVARDLHRTEGESEASFSERGIYDNVIALIAQEVAIAKDFTETQAMALIRENLDRSPAPTGKSDGGGASDEGDEVNAKVA